MRIMVRINQEFPLRARKLRKGGFRMNADSMVEALAEIARWRAADIEIAGSSSFAGALLYDLDAFDRDPLHAKPIRTIAAG
jgi:hypothetical protein